MTYFAPGTPILLMYPQIALCGVSGPLCRRRNGGRGGFGGFRGPGRGFSLVVGYLVHCVGGEMSIGAVFGGLGGREGVFL